MGAQWKSINSNYKNLEGYKRVAWPPASEERIVREFTPQPQTQYQPTVPAYNQQQPNQQQPSAAAVPSTQGPIYNNVQHRQQHHEPNNPNNFAHETISPYNQNQIQYEAFPPQQPETPIVLLDKQFSRQASHEPIQTTSVPYQQQQQYQQQQPPMVQPQNQPLQQQQHQPSYNQQIYQQQYQPNNQQNVCYPQHPYQQPPPLQQQNTPSTPVTGWKPIQPPKPKQDSHFTSPVGVNDLTTPAPIYQQQFQNYHQQPQQQQQQQYRAPSHDTYQQPQQQQQYQQPPQQQYSPQPQYQASAPNHNQYQPQYQAQPQQVPQYQQTQQPQGQVPQYQQPEQQYQQPPWVQQQPTQVAQQQYQQPPWVQQEPQQNQQLPQQQQYQQPQQQSQTPFNQYQAPHQQYQPPQSQQNQFVSQPSQQFNSYSQPQQQQHTVSHDQLDNLQQTQSLPQDYRGGSPGIITLRKEAPITQKPAPVYTSQPAAVSYQELSTDDILGGCNMRGDLKWPPPEYKEAAVKENEERCQLAAGPVCRPRQVKRDYTTFFAKNALSHHYPSYKVPPGTQHMTC